MTVDGGRGTRQRLPRPGETLGSVLFYGVGLLLALAVVVLAQASAAGYQRLAERSDAAGRSRLVLEDLTATLSLGLWGGSAETRAEVRAIGEGAAAYGLWANRAGTALAGLCLVFLAWRLHLWRRQRALRGFLVHGFAVAALLLVVGVSAPILTLTAFEDVPVLGPVVLSHEVKSVLSIIYGLASRGDAFVALLLALFSLVIPAVKLVLSVAAPLLAPGAGRRRVLAIVHHGGRWSMADVFVVAVLLAYLATGDGQSTDAQVGIGLYFFAGYTLLSLLLGQVMGHTEESWIRRDAQGSDRPDNG